MLRPVPSQAHGIIRRAELDHIHSRYGADLLDMIHSLLLLDHEAQHNVIQPRNVLLLSHAIGAAYEPAVGAAVPAVCPLHQRTDGIDGVPHLLRRPVIGEVDSLKAGSNCLLRHIKAVLEIHLNHGTHLIQLRGPGHILQIRLGKGRVLRHKFHIVEIPCSAKGLRIKGPCAPQAGGYRSLALPQDAAQLVLSHHNCFSSLFYLYRPVTAKS